MLCCDTLLRCPAARLSEFIDAGITAVVGLLGTDDISRTQEELIVKVGRNITWGTLDE